MTKILNGLKITEIPYPQATHSSTDPVLWIPRWNFAAGDTYELQLTDFAAILFYHNGQYFLQDAFSREPITANADHFFNDLQRVFQMRSSKKEQVSYFSIIAYEALSTQSVNDVFYKLPGHYSLIPGNGLLINHTQQKAWRYTHPAGLKPKPQKYIHLQEDSGISFNQAQSAYLKNIEKVRELIRAGEVYQLNYTMRLSSNAATSGMDFFRALYKRNSAPFSFYARLPHCELISNSPERFIRFSAEKLSTSPVKGTAPRGDNPEQDRQFIDSLTQSEKESAELSMIVDLLRNDLSRISRPGTVRVTAHKRLQTFANVHHLVSTIESMPEGNLDLDKLYRAMLPGGSISGCPKEAAVQYIKELEPHNRSFYTGALFWHFPVKSEFDSSILIRTAIQIADKLHFQTGGGIVIDSDPQAEYAECMAKAASFIETVEQKYAAF